MPELPEVETIKNYLKKEILGEKIKEIRIFNKKQILGNYKDFLLEKILDLERKGKLLIFKLTNNKFILFHLKLTGQILINSEINKTTRAIFHLTKKNLIFNDARKFGYIKFLKEKELEKELNNLGKDALLINFKEFKKIFNSQKPVKTLLMDQKKVSGIGNIYANEALLLAKINPLRKAFTLKENEIKKLFQAIKKVLKTGIKYQGTSFRFYLKPNQQKGKYQEHFLVYRRKGEKCLRCKNEIKYMKISGRGTFYCPKCQKA